MAVDNGVTFNWIRALLATLAVATLLLGVTAIILLPNALYPMPIQVAVDASKLTEKEKLDTLNGMVQQQNSLRAMLLQSFAGLTVASGAVLAWRQFIHTRRDAVRQQQEKQEAFHLDLFGEALKSLGANEPGLRIGGVYALGRLAEISTSHRPACADVLSTFIRTGSPWPPTPSRPPESEIMIADTGRSLRDYCPDIQTALSVLGMHTYLWHRVDYIRLRHLDLRKVNLSDGRYQGFAFTETRLDGGWLKRADFNGASFRGASLVNAELEDANMDNCNLRDVDLTGARLNGVSLRNAVFDIRTRWPDGFSAEDAVARGARKISESAPATSVGPTGVKEE